MKTTHTSYYEKKCFDCYFLKNKLHGGCYTHHLLTHWLQIFEEEFLKH